MMKRILRYFRAKQFDRDLKAEIATHLEEKIDEYIEEGWESEAARTKALRQFGNRTRIRADWRNQWAYVSLDEIIQDLRYAVRILMRSPMFATVSILSLALGVGVNAIVFGVVDQVLIRSLPYLEPKRLFSVSSRSPNHGTEPMQVSAADFYDWRGESRTFESLSAYSSWPVNLTDVEEPRRLKSELVSANLFSTLGVGAEIGRTFLADEEQESSQPVVVISHRSWRELGASAQIIGRPLTLNGSFATVIGVMPASFVFPNPEVDAWVPLSLSAQNRSNRDGRWLSIVGRLNSSASERDATAELNVITRRLADTYPTSNAGLRAAMMPLKEQLVGKTRPILLTVQIAALFLLLITCANLVNLLLARGASRTREMAMRVALGATRARVFRQLLIESLVLATFGGGLGLALTVPGIEFARKLGVGVIPRAEELHLDASVALFAMAATVVTTLVFGLAPAINAARANLGPQMGSGTRGTERNVERSRGLLISLEVGIASVLLIGAGLVGESMVRLLLTPTGLHADHLLTIRLTLSGSQYPTNSAQIAFFDQGLSRVRSLPGVVTAGEISDTPHSRAIIQRSRWLLKAPRGCQQISRYKQASA